MLLKQKLLMALSIKYPKRIYSKMDFDIEALSRDCDRASFSCGNVMLDRYLRTQAIQDRDRKLSKCFVALDKDRSKDKSEKRRIAGFYTLTSDSISTALYSAKIGKAFPYEKIPLALLGRFAIDTEYQDQGVGLYLVVDAAERALRAEMGIFGLFVEAKDENSQSWYIRRGFVLIDEETRQLVFPLAKLFELKNQLNK